MRQQSEVQLTVRGVVIGGPQPLICLPLVGEKKAEFLEEAQELVAFEPDLTIDLLEQFLGFLIPGPPEVLDQVGRNQEQGAEAEHHPSGKHFQDTSLYPL